MKPAGFRGVERGCAASERRQWTVFARQCRGSQIAKAEFEGALRTVVTLVSSKHGCTKASRSTEIWADQFAAAPATIKWCLPGVHMCISRGAAYLILSTHKLVSIDVSGVYLKVHSCKYLLPTYYQLMSGALKYIGTAHMPYPAPTAHE